MKDEGDGRAGPASGVETAFETALGTGKNDFGHMGLGPRLERDRTIDGRQVHRRRGAYIGWPAFLAILRF